MRLVPGSSEFLLKVLMPRSQSGAPTDEAGPALMEKSGLRQ